VTKPVSIMPSVHIRTALVVFVLFVPCPGIAYPVQGPGATSCGEFAKMYQADPSIELIFYTWAQGYMSAINIAAVGNQKQPRELAGQSADQKRALRSYCADNPLKKYMDGVLEFYGKLPFFPKSSQ
jgi:hypothetical protein